MSAGRITALLVFLLVAAGCDLLGPSPKGKADPENIPTTYSTDGPNGLVQTLVVSPPTGGFDDPKYVGLESVVKNNGAFAQRVITRSCVILPEDITGKPVTLIPQSGSECTERTADTLDLQPGQSTSIVEGRFRINGLSPGVHEFNHRQLLSPLFVITFRFRL
jgi:hypothetical protein